MIRITTMHGLGRFDWSPALQLIYFTKQGHRSAAAQWPVPSAYNELDWVRRKVGRLIADGQYE